MIAATAGQGPKETSASETGTSKTVVTEVGGRLVVTGETVVVEGRTGRPPADSSVATKIDTPLLETPRSVSVIDRRMLDDRAAINLSQVHDYTVGVMPVDERGPAISRGFPLDFYDLRRDGLRTYGWSVREPVALERVQYLRGAASVFYGDGSPGGLVNMVLKKPLPVRRTEVGFGAGELDFKRFTVDTTGPIGGDRSLRYRVVGAGEWLDNGYANDEHRLTLLPTLSWDVGRTATLSFDTELYRQRGRNYRHAVPATEAAQRGDFSAVPWDLSMGAPYDQWTGENVAPGIRADVRLGDRTSLHVAGRYTKIDGDLDLEALLRLSPDNRTALRYHYREISTWNEYQGDAFLTLERSTGSITHRIVAGVESGYSTTDTELGVGAAAPLDIYAPEYGPRPSDVQLSPVRYDVTRLGFYASDQLRLGKHVTLVPGLRAGYIQTFDHVATADRQPRSTETPIAPSVGLVVMPRSWLSLYSTYARGFTTPAPGSYLESGRALELSTSTTFEGGVKTDLPGRWLTASAAVFHIGQTNVPEADAQGFYRQIGAAESQGLEVEITGRIWGGLSARASYAHIATEITEDVSGFAGNDLPNAPPGMSSVWLRYQPQAGRASILTIGGGLVHVSDRFAGRDNVIVVPDYTRADLSASCELPHAGLRLAAVAENVTNRRYVTSGSGAVFFAGAPRRVALQLSTRF